MNTPTAGAGARPVVLIADPISESGIELLRTECEVLVATNRTPDGLIAAATEARILIVRSETKVNESMLAACPNLELVGRAGAGVDNIDVEAASRLGVLVVNAPSGNTNAAAEHTVAMILSLVRNIPAADRSVREGRWERGRFKGVELEGKTLGVIGLGRIGQEVARICHTGLGMRVIGYDPIVGDDRAQEMGIEPVSFDGVLAHADILTLHIPLTEGTTNLIGRRELGAMRPGSRLVNVARGGIVDEAALADAIATGHLAGAALDVFSEEPVPGESPLRGLDTVIMTPHLGASTEEAQTRVAEELAEQVLQYLHGSTPRFAVNLPGTDSDGRYVTLARRLGSLAGQLSRGGIDRIVCAYGDQVGEEETGRLTGEVLTRIFAAFTDERVNAVNARYVAADRGIAVEETIRRAGHDPGIAVRVEGRQSIEIAGDVVSGEPHISRINGFPIDITAQGQFLVVTHEDKPGVLAAVARLLAAADINIGSVGLGRDRPRGRAVMVMQVDDPVPVSLLRAVESDTGADSASVVTV